MAQLWWRNLSPRKSLCEPEQSACFFATFSDNSWRLLCGKFQLMLCFVPKNIANQRTRFLLFAGPCMECRALQKLQLAVGIRVLWWNPSQTAVIESTTQGIADWGD